jgi:hypothetical protein
MTTDHRQAASAKIAELIALLRAGQDPGLTRILEECQALANAVSAFHMEGIRFRMFNVDRLLGQQAVPVPADAMPMLEDVRRHLEAAGFHTRSHQAPG